MTDKDFRGSTETSARASVERSPNVWITGRGDAIAPDKNALSQHLLFYSRLQVSEVQSYHCINGKMKPYSIDLREKIVTAYSQGDTSVRKVAERFGVAKSLVQKLLSLQKTQGHLEPIQQSGGMKGELDGCESCISSPG